jgi:hypothetical protein
VVPTKYVEEITFIVEMKKEEKDSVTVERIP